MEGAFRDGTSAITGGAIMQYYTTIQGGGKAMCLGEAMFWVMQCVSCYVVVKTFIYVSPTLSV